MNPKTKLRQHYAQIRSEISPTEQAHAASLACENFIEKVPFKNTDIISAYYPVSNEISPLPLLKKLAEMGVKTALPVIIDKKSPLVFYSWQDGDNLKEHASFKIKEPIATDAVIPTIIIVPLLAFDKSGHRLGYGGGFYDRTIENLKATGHQITTVGLAYSTQATDELQPEPHDQMLDYVVTENQVFRF